MNITFNDVLPWALGAAGLIVAAHFLTHNETDPELAAATNTVDYPNFPGIGTEPHHDLTNVNMDPQVQFPHPYAHPVIPRYIGAPAYFQNSIQLDESHYNDAAWEGQQTPPLHVTVSQNQPSPETYSHHHFYFEQPEPEPTPLENGIMKNIV